MDIVTSKIEYRDTVLVLELDDDKTIEISIDIDHPLNESDAYVVDGELTVTSEINICSDWIANVCALTDEQFNDLHTSLTRIRKEVKKLVDVTSNQ